MTAPLSRPEIRFGNQDSSIPSDSSVSRRQCEGRPAVAGKCDVCGKAKTFGKNVSFSKRRTNRDFRANVQRKRIVVNGVGIRLDICTRCLRTMGKSGKVAA
jgi:large subunit ribosomal protein L28